MKKMHLLLVLIVMSFNLMAKDIVLDKEKVSIDLGDITNLANKEIVETLSLIQNAQTPKQVTVDISYQKPELLCTDEEDYIVTPDCSSDDLFPGQIQDCDQYIATRCITYEFSTDPDEKSHAVSRYVVKFKKPTNQDKTFEIRLRKNEVIGKRKSVFDTVTEDHMYLTHTLLKGDFKKMKIKEKSLFRFNTKIILK